jgi:hypothetical protein
MHNGVTVLPSNKGLSKHVTIKVGKKTFGVFFAVEPINKGKGSSQPPSKFKLLACSIKSLEEKQIIGKDSEFCSPVLEQLKRMIK